MILLRIFSGFLRVYTALAVGLLVAFGCMQLSSCGSKQEQEQLRDKRLEYMRHANRNTTRDIKGLGEASKIRPVPVAPAAPEPAPVPAKSAPVPVFALRGKNGN